MRGLRLMTSRLFHLASLGIVLLVAATSYALAPELWSGRSAAFATIGGFFTVYGVVFAVIETWRARKASELASEAASVASEKTVSLFNVRNIAECQATIRDVLRDLDSQGWASAATLSRILELYTAEFQQAYRDPLSTQRAAIASLQSHAASATGPLTAHALGRLKATLMTMLTDLAAASSQKVTETGK